MDGLSKVEGRNGNVHSRACVRACVPELTDPSWVEGSRGFDRFNPIFGTWITTKKLEGTHPPARVHNIEPIKLEKEKIYNISPHGRSHSWLLLAFLRPPNDERVPVFSPLCLAINWPESNVFLACVFAWGEGAPLRTKNVDKLEE